jgi:hypothetical protein
LRTGEEEKGMDLLGQMNDLLQKIYYKLILIEKKIIMLEEKLDE